MYILKAEWCLVARNMVYNSPLETKKKPNPSNAMLNLCKQTQIFSNPHSPTPFWALSKGFRPQIVQAAPL